MGRGQRRWHDDPASMLWHERKPRSVSTYIVACCGFPITLLAGHQHGANLCDLAEQTWRTLPSERYASVSQRSCLKCPCVTEMLPSKVCHRYFHKSVSQRSYFQKCVTGFAQKVSHRVGPKSVSQRVATKSVSQRISFWHTPFSQPPRVSSSIFLLSPGTFLLGQGDRH